MTRLLLALLISLQALAISQVTAVAGGGMSAEARSRDPARVSDAPVNRDGADGVDAQVPAYALAVLDAIRERDGEPLPGYVGGQVFQNRERRLPPGRYREYDVHPRRSGRGRGAERIVIERETGEAYYTRDHYRTFLRMN